MPRFILRYQGSGAAQVADVARFRALPSVTILDTASDRMLLVEGEEEELARAVGTMPGWILVPERTVPLPDTRKKVRRSPDAPKEPEDDSHS